MRRYRGKALAALWKHGPGTGKAILAVLALAPLTAWTGQGAPLTAAQGGPSGGGGAISSAIHGYCLSSYSNYVGPGLIAGIDKCENQAAQHWTLPGNNTVRVQGKCLAAKAKTVGTGLVLAKCDGSRGQFWEADGVVRVPGTQLLNPWSGKCMTDPHASTADDTQVQLGTCDRTVAETWYLPPHQAPLLVRQGRP
jgi:Ricin-type beta-trefoil lectin domain